MQVISIVLPSNMAAVQNLYSLPACFYFFI